MMETTPPQETTSAEGTPPPMALPLMIVDASNVAFGGRNSGGKPRLSFLLEVVAQIPRTRYEVQVIADASLKHRIDNKQEYENLVRKGTFLQVPAGRSADQFIALLVRKRKAEGQQVRILTNDLLRQYPDLERLRVTFLAVGEPEVLFDPPLFSVTLETKEPVVVPVEPVPFVSGVPLEEDGF